MENEKLEILYDHYKDTYALSRETQTRRNKAFVVLCVLEAIAFLTLINEGSIFDIIRGFINKELEQTILLGNTILQTLLWIFIVYIMIRYVQDTLYIERHYSYLKKLEQEISDLFGRELFTREGKHYKENISIVIKIIEIFYKVFMPVLFLIINTVKICIEWSNMDNNILSVILDSFLYIALLLIIWFYFFEINSKLTEYVKNHIPIINNIAVGFRKVLVEGIF